MTQEYEFFKDFAGVTKADLEMFKCGGKKKVAKDQNGELIRMSRPGYRKQKLKELDNQKKAAYDSSHPKARQDNTQSNTPHVNKEVVRTAKENKENQINAERREEFRRRAAESINSMKREGSWQNSKIKTNEDFPPERQVKRKK